MKIDPTREGYWIYEWYEECSSLTPNASWRPGGEYYAVKCRMWIPNSISGEDYDELDRYIEEHDDHEESWVI